MDVEISDHEQPRCCAVIVTYHPDRDLHIRVAKLSEQVNEIFIINNGQGDWPGNPLAECEKNTKNVVVVSIGQNSGIAHALNVGLRMAKKRGYLLACLFDQDSCVTDGMISALIAVYSAQCRKSPVAVVAPAIKDRNDDHTQCTWLKPHPKHRFLFSRVEPHDAPQEISVAITSGSLISIEAYDTLGPFWSTLFIDYVDTEWCLRAQASGYKILGTGDALLEHSLGARSRVTLFGASISPTNHSPLRHYYIARNRVHIWKKHGSAFPHWLMFDIVAMMYNLARVVAFEGERSRKMKAFIRGTRDGLMSRLGPAPKHAAR